MKRDRTEAPGRYTAALRLLNTLIAVAIAITAWRAYAGIAGPPPATNPVPVQRVELGATIGLAAVSWSESPRHVVLAIRSTCPACNASDEFYRELSSRLQGSTQATIVVVSPDPEPTISQWLTSRSIQVSETVASVDLYSLGFAATPTVLLVDSQGTVTDILAGKLTPEEEGQLFRRLDGLGPPVNNTRYAKLIDPAGFDRLRSQGPIFLLDVRDRASFIRGHRQGATNIPHDELGQRAAVEVPLSQPVAIACPGIRHSVCEIASEALIDLGVYPVYTLVEGGASGENSAAAGKAR